MKTLKTNLKILSVGFTLCAFMAWDIDPSNWDGWLRVVCVVGVSVGFVWAKMKNIEIK